MSAAEIRKNFENLAARVDGAGGCLSVRMGELRDLVQAGRLDDGPVGQIKHNLRFVHLDATALSRAQGDWALIYRIQSTVGRIIMAAQGGTEKSGEDLLAAVRDHATADDELKNAAAEELDSLRATVEQIKALVSSV